MNRASSWIGLGAVAVVTAGALLIGSWVVGEEGKETPSSGSSVSVSGVQAMPRTGETAPADEALPVGDGEPVWLVFMATWCQECRVEAPDVQEASKRGDVKVVGVFVGEDEATVSDYAKRTSLTFDTVADADGSISARYGVRAVPSHFLVSGDGVVREVTFGALSAPAIKEKLDALTS